MRACLRRLRRDIVKYPTRDSLPGWSQSWCFTHWRTVVLQLCDEVVLWSLMIMMLNFAWHCTEVPMTKYQPVVSSLVLLFFSLCHERRVKWPALPKLLGCALYGHPVLLRGLSIRFGNMLYVHFAALHLMFALGDVGPGGSWQTSEYFNPVGFR